MKLQIGRASGAQFISMLLLAPVVFCLFEFWLHRHNGIYREYAAAFLSLQWELLACLAVWCGTFLLLTFNSKNWPLIALLSIVITIYFIGYTVHPSRDALTLLASVTLGKGVSFALKENGRWKVEDGESKLAILHPRSSILIFLTGLVMLLAFASWGHLDMTNNYYHGPRWMGLWDNPNTYGMLMGAGSALAIGLLAQKLKFEKLKAEMGATAKAESGKAGKRETKTWLPIVAAAKSAIRNHLFIFLFIAAGMMLVGLVMSYSRGAWLGMGLGLLYLAWCYGKLKWKYVAVGAGLLALGVLFFWGNTQDAAQWYVKRADLGRPSAQHRATAWRAGLEIMRDHPLGVGWNNAVRIYGEKYNPPEGGPGAITTNDYMMIGTELGIAALVCFVAYVGLCYRKSPKLHLSPTLSPFDPSAPVERGEGEAIRAACLAGALVLLVGFWFDGGLFKLPTAALFWVLLELGAHRAKDEGRMMNEEVKAV